jgi:hypothetical protein
VSKNLTPEERDAVANDITYGLALQMRDSGLHHEEVVCVLLHAAAIAERNSARSHALGVRPADLPSAPDVIAECRAELQRRAG